MSQTLLKGAGCGVLLTLWYLKELLSPSRLPVYFHPFPLATVFLAVLVDLIVISLVAGLVWAGIERLNKASALWPVLLTGVVLLESHSIIYLYSRGWWDLPRETWAALTAAVLIASFALRWRNRAWFERATGVAGWSLVFWGFPLFYVIPELAYMAARTSSHEALGFSHAATVSRVTVPKIYWILFDELSYDQVYEHRAAGLTLSNFDRLRDESVTLSNVRPAGDHTNIAIPAMFLGRPASQMRSSAGGSLSLYSTDRRRWEQFDASQTIFADARRLGWTSSIVGWANPYCRFMAGWVDDCYWLPEDAPIVAEANMDSRKGTIANAASMPLQWLHMLIPIGASNGEEYKRDWVAAREHNYDQAMDRARTLIQKSSIRFQFIHLPVPHPPAIYDRKTHSRSTGGSYLDNLALADVALGELLDQLEASPEWPETTLIVCGDHSWRPWIWEHLGPWTSEDQGASRGLYDPRPVLEVHLPGQRRGFEHTSAFQAFAVASVLEGIMRGKINYPEDLSSLSTATYSSK